MKAVFIIIITLLSLYCLHKACLWLEKRGLLYYWHKKPSSCLLGVALQELEASLNPAYRNVIEVKQNQVQHKRCEEDVPSNPLRKNQ